jgi:hypothetical protein
MREWPAIDSWQYVVAIELRSIEDCPPDFELPASLAGFDAGLFLPRDDPDWFGRSCYPPRILLLKGNALHIISHPSAGEPPRQWEVERISSVESGHTLLQGWLRFSGPGFDGAVRYNTRGLPPVSRFMQRLRAALPRGAQPHRTAAVHFGGGLDIKFANALAGELDSAEAILMRVFQPPEEMRRRKWPLPRGRWSAGDLLALTDRRLLWITDRERESRSRFGSITSYTRLDAVASIRLTSGRSGDRLEVDLNSGSAWQFPMALEGHAGRQRMVEDFVAALEIQKARNRANFTSVSMRSDENLM